MEGNILFISDMHVPHHHKDALNFLRALHEKYKFKRIVSVGDECDWQAMSYHDKNPDLKSPGDELQSARETLHELCRIFPVMEIIESNHGALVFRKALSHGFPRHTISSYGDTIFGDRDKNGNIVRKKSLGLGWTWHPKIILELGDGHKCLVVHGDGTSENSFRNVTQSGMSFVSGHWHSKFDIQYHSTSEFLHFGIAVGCLVDPNHPAFDYGRKRVLKRPIIGCAGIVNGLPRLFPMQLKKGGRWAGEIS